MRAQPTSSIFVAGQPNDDADSSKSNESESVNVKPYQLQRQTKNRAAGLRASDFLARHFESFKAVSDKTKETCYDDAWLIADLLKLDINTTKEPSAVTYEDVLATCLDSLFLSPSAKRMIREASSNGWHVGVVELDEQDFHLDVPGKVIYLNDNNLSAQTLIHSGYFQNVLCVSIIRALRDVWQETRHGGFDEDYSPEYILMMERVRAADCDVLTILTGWEMRSEGEADLWRHLIGSEEGDMAIAFSNHLERMPASQFNGKALGVAFKKWFSDEARVNACDHETLEYMDSVMSKYPVGNPFGSKKPTRIGVEILSCLPDKTAYLRGMGDEILRDPVYSGMGDEINQLHLLQIQRDMKVTYVEGVAFRDTMLAEKIFPEDFMLEGSEAIH